MRARASVKPRGAYTGELGLGEELLAATGDNASNNLRMTGKQFIFLGFSVA